MTNLQPGRRAASFWVVRFILSLVVDNCMLWYLFQGRISLPVILTTALSSPTQDVYNSTDIIRPSDSLTCTVCVDCDLGFFRFVCLFFLSCSKLQITRMTVLQFWSYEKTFWSDGLRCRIFTLCAGSAPRGEAAEEKGGGAGGGEGPVWEETKRHQGIWWNGAQHTTPYHSLCTLGR